MARKSVVVTPVAGQAGAVARAQDWRASLRAMSPVGSRGLILIAIAVVLAGQLVEDAADGTRLHLLPPNVSIRRWVIIALVSYEMLVAAFLQRTMARSLTALRPVLRIDEPTFAAYGRDSRPLTPLVDVLLFAISVVVVLAVFVVVGVEPLLDDPAATISVSLPSGMLAAGIVLAGYSVLGWAGLRLAYLAARLARVVARLSREPMEINVFNTVNLLPFGNVGLAVALAPAGVTVLLFGGLGLPSTVLGWVVMLLFMFSALLGLLLPLRSIHRRMSVAKDTALAALDVRSQELYEQAVKAPAAPADVAHVRDMAATLLPLRKAVAEMPTWPFRNTVAFARAMLIASAPLIYTALNELIRLFVIGPLAPR